VTTPYHGALNGDTTTNGRDFIEVQNIYSYLIVFDDESLDKLPICQTLGSRLNLSPSEIMQRRNLNSVRVCLVRLELLGNAISNYVTRAHLCVNILPYFYALG